MLHKYPCTNYVTQNIAFFGRSDMFSELRTKQMGERCDSNFVWIQMLFTKNELLNCISNSLTMRLYVICLW